MTAPARTFAANAKPTNNPTPRRGIPLPVALTQVGTVAQGSPSLPAARPIAVPNAHQTSDAAGSPTGGFSGVAADRPSPRPTRDADPHSAAECAALPGGSCSTRNGIHSAAGHPHSQTVTAAACAALPGGESPQCDFVPAAGRPSFAESNRQAVATPRGGQDTAKRPALPPSRAGGVPRILCNHSPGPDGRKRTGRAISCAPSRPGRIPSKSKNLLRHPPRGRKNRLEVLPMPVTTSASRRPTPWTSDELAAALGVCPGRAHRKLSQFEAGLSRILDAVDSLEAETACSPKPSARVAKHRQSKNPHNRAASLVALLATGGRLAEMNRAALQARLAQIIAEREKDSRP